MKCWSITVKSDDHCGPEFFHKIYASLVQSDKKIKWWKISSLSEMPVWILIRYQMNSFIYNLYVIQMNLSDSGKSFGV